MSRVSVDLNARTFEVEVPDESLPSVIKILESLFKSVPSSGQAPRSAPVESIPDEPETSDNSQTEPSKKKKRSKGGAKVRTFATVDLSLTAPQRLALQKFFSEQNPHGQNDQVAVLAVKIKELTGKTEFTGDEIHSAFKVVNRPTPKNLVAVMGNMKRDGRAGYSDNKLQVTNYTEDHVNFHMKKTDKAKSGK